MKLHGSVCNCGMHVKFNCNNIYRIIHIGLSHKILRIMARRWADRQGRTISKGRHLMIICLWHLRSLQNYGRLNKNQSTVNANKKDIFDFDHDVPINQHCDQTFCELLQGTCSSWENCELEHSSWNTVYMIMTFHTEHILKAALATSYGLPIRQ